MAGDWIKMRTGLRRHPKVIAMSRNLAADREFINWWADPTRHSVKENVTELVTFENLTRVTVCGLLEVWGAVNAADKGDGHVPYMEVIDIDDIAGIPGFGEAMLLVGWLRLPEEDGLQGVVFPNFCEFNTPDSKRKQAKSDAERAREYRQRKKAKEEAEAERHERHETSHREEKRREEKRNKEKPLVASDDATSEKSDEREVWAREFEEVWRSRAQRSGPDSKRDGLEKYIARRREGHTHDEIMRGVLAYRNQLRSEGKEGTRFVKTMKTFLGPSKHFLDVTPAPAPAQLSQFRGCL
jgi:hypothetical protein